jgi:xylulokinase
MDYREGGDVGPALGAARLAAIGDRGQHAVNDVCVKPKLIKQYQPDLTKSAIYAKKRERFHDLYQRLKGL